MKIQEIGKYNIIIDFNDLFTKSITSLYYKQGEVGTASVKAKLVKKHTTIDLTGCRVLLNIVSPKGESIVDTANIIDAKEGIVEIKLEPVALSTGISFFELTIVDESYNSKKSPRYAYRVLDSLSEDAVIQSEKYPILVNLIRDVDDLQKTTQGLHDQTVALNQEVRELNATMTEAERVRNDNEETRKSNETNRINKMQENQTTFDNMVQEGEIATSNMNTLKGQVETLKTQTEQVKADTEKVKNDTSLVKTQTETVKNETLAVKNATETVKSETLKVKEDTIAVKDNTLVAKANTEKATANANNKIVDCEGRMKHIEDNFNSLVDGTGFASKEYVDKKTNVIFTQNEGESISVQDSLKGYIQDFEILGNTVQNPENLADIKSSGIVEGDNFKYSVNVCGKNLFDKNEFISYVKKWDETAIETTEDGEEVIEFITSRFDLKPFMKNRFKQNTRYTIKLSMKMMNGNVGYVRAFYTDGTYSNLCIANNLDYTIFTGTTKPDKTIKFIYVSYGNSNYRARIKLDSIQLEEGTVATSYEPYKGNKIDILSPIQLEGIGDVKDRIVEKNGVWGVEKNVVKINNFNKYSISVDTNLSSVYRMRFDLDFNPKDKLALSNKLKFEYGYSLDEEHFYIQPDLLTRLWVFVSKQKIDAMEGDNTNTKFVNWLNSNLEIYVTTSTPTFTPLPNSQQILLNSLEGTTHLFLDSGEIQGSMKASVATSLGAVVNSNTKEIEDIYGILGALTTILEGLVNNSQPSNPSQETPKIEGEV